MNNSDKCYKQVLEKIKNANSIAILTHVNPDGDAIGSSLAIYHFARNLGKNVNIIIDKSLPNNLKFMPLSSEILVSSEETNAIIHCADLILILDLNDSRRLGNSQQATINSKGYKILIDHHTSPTITVDLSVIDTEATSTGELVHKVLTADGSEPLTKEIAICLYAAIMSDTGGFRYQRTDSEILRISADLIDIGADPVNIYDEVYNRIPHNILILLATAMGSIKLFANGKIAVMTITNDNFKATNTREEDIEDFVDKTLMIDTVKIGILLTEIASKEEIRMSFRSKGVLSIREIAVHFGGGGHINAAGATVRGADFWKLRDEAIKKAEEMLN